MPSVNKAIALVAHGHPVYSRRIDDPADQNDDGGVGFARTWAEYPDDNLEAGFPREN